MEKDNDRFLRIKQNQTPNVKISRNKTHNMNNDAKRYKSVNVSF